MKRGLPSRERVPVPKTGPTNRVVCRASLPYVEHMLTRKEAGWLRFATVRLATRTENGLRDAEFHH